VEVVLRQLHGPWDAGWALNKHMLRSTYLGDDEYGHPRFDSVRTDVGEATYQLKYRQDWGQAQHLAKALMEHVLPKLPRLGFIVPMPASTVRARQPVTEVAQALSASSGIPVFPDLLRKASNGKSLKDLQSKEEKIEAIGDSFTVHDAIKGSGPWDALIVDDLFHTGASMEAACAALRKYPKVRNVYVAALTWR
jgi:predicted amidophosphoribosyltransferase